MPSSKGTARLATNPAGYEVECRRRNGPGFRNGEGLPTLDKLFANRALEVAGVASMGDGQTADGVLGFSSLLNQRPDFSDGETGILENSGGDQAFGLVHKHW